MNWLKRNWVDALMIFLIVSVIGGISTLVLRGSQVNVTAPITSMAPLKNPAVILKTPVQSQTSSIPAPMSAKVIPKTNIVTKPATVNRIRIAKAIIQNPSINTQTNTTPTTPKVPEIAKVVQMPKKEVLKSSKINFLTSYRVAIGTFSTATRANTAVSKLQNMGLPAVNVLSGNVNVVVIGPYKTEETAQSTLTLVQSNYPDSILYRPDGSRSTRLKPTSAAITSTINKIPKINTAPVPITTTRKTNIKYLQIAAFRNSASATPLLTKLRNLKYAAFLQYSPNGFTRVLIGPLETNALKSIRLSLQQNGYTPFATEQ